MEDDEPRESGAVPPLSTPRGVLAGNSATIRPIDDLLSVMPAPRSGLISALRHSPPWGLLLLVLCVASGFIDHVLLQILNEPIKRTFQLSDLQLGVLTGLAFALVSATAGLAVARLAERFSRVKMLAIGSVIWSVATIATSASTSFAQLLLTRFGVAIGETVLLPSTASLVSDLFPPVRRVKALSVTLVAPTFGAFIASVLGAWVAQREGWRAAFVLAGLPGLVLAVLLAVTMAEPMRGQYDRVRNHDHVPSFGDVVRRLWVRRSLRNLIAGWTVVTGCGFGFNAFVIPLLIRRFAFSLAQAGVAAGLILAVASCIGVLGGGWLAGRLGARRPSMYCRVPALGLSMAGPLLAIGVTRTDARVAIGCITLGSVLMYTFSASSTALLQNMLHPRMRATGLAVAGLCTGILGGALGPIAVGWLSDLFEPGGGSTGYGLSVALTFASLGLLWAAAYYWYAARFVASDLARPID